MVSVFDRDCLYYGLGNEVYILEALIPFCVRPETVKQSNDDDKLCYGTNVMFKELKINNVSIAELFRWNAVIEIIDLYEKYLLLPNLVNDDQFYCNCSILSRFGKSCQYDIGVDDEQTFAELFFFMPHSELNEEVENEYLTCYIGIQCQTNLFCLDWRQICNGIVDCDHGEDEPVELCLQMESNECNTETEFRCQTGLCIPMSLAVDEIEACPDRSDRTRASRTVSPSFLIDLCIEYPSYECDEINRGWKRFSCNNGQYISYSDLTSKVRKRGKTCSNNEHLKYLKRLFFVTNENECWKSMICLSGFDYLYSNISCSNYEIIGKDIERYCPDEFYFPSNSVVYSFVFFFYDKINSYNWSNSTGPNNICYKKEHCQNNTWIFSTISKNNLTCFHVDQRIFSWKNFFEYIIYLFDSCYNQSISINDKMFYKCNISNQLISIYRVKDKKKDCFFNEDENSDIDLCLLNTNDQFKCLTNENECIRKLFLNDDQYDCLDGSDEYFPACLDGCNDQVCEFRPWRKENLPQVYRFHELCDEIVNCHLFPEGSNETDETDCEYWPYSCNSVYTKCNEIWNCKDGRDEINCWDGFFNNYIRHKFHCDTNEHYCLQLINNGKDINITCINRNRIGNDIIDCIGGTDERLTSVCNEEYPIDQQRRFHCINSSLCITPEQVCDTIIDCPFQDDERICPWLFKSNSSKFYCNNASLHPVVRCTKSNIVDKNCKMNENLWFCDLKVDEQVLRKAPSIAFEVYPPNNQYQKAILLRNLNSNQLMISEKSPSSLIDINNDPWLCNFGYLIKSSISTNKSYCFCPPPYYGDFCQYQSERLTVFFKVKIRYYMDPLTVFRLIIYLLDENNFILSSDEILFNHIVGIHTMYRVYLMYERVRDLPLYQRSKSKFVRIDSYIIKETDVQYISSSFFHVSFSFLPVNRLATELLLVNQLFKIVNCKKQCGPHGKCMYYLNGRDTEYCWCEQGWFGDKCQVKSSSNLCNKTSCSPYSQKKQTKCICPLGKHGDQCYITYNSCSNVRCQNNQTCLPFDQRAIKYHCICKDNDDDDEHYCEESGRYTDISIDANITDLSPIPAIIVIVVDVSENILEQTRRFLYKNIRLPTTIKMKGRGRFVFVQMFHNFSKSFYYVALIQEVKVDVSYTNTSVISKNLCKNVNEMFNETILYEYTYLKRLKLYHLPCQHDYNLRCFFDEYRMCICNQNHHTHCYLFSHERGNCNYCKNDGLSSNSDYKTEQWNFVCLCPEYVFGNICQFAPVNYYITLDMLVGTEMKTGDISFNEQSTIIYCTLAILIIILIFSLIFNTISIIVFSNNKLRQVGCDLYLLNLTIFSQIGLIILFLRFVYMILIQIYTIENVLFLQISCIILEYFLRLIPSLFDWLTVCISIERAYTVIKDVHFTKVIALKTLKVSRWIILIVLLLNILTTFHCPFYLILVDEPNFADEPQGHPWCVLDFQSISWDLYEKVINIAHLVIPLVLNITSMIFFISRKVQFELTSATRKNKGTKFDVIKEQLLKYKPLLISTMIIILLEFPRFILTFSLACMKHSWQRYVYLTGYLISFLPLTGVLFIYILPSPKYKQQMKKVVNRLSCSTLFKTA